MQAPKYKKMQETKCWEATQKDDSVQMYKKEECLSRQDNFVKKSKAI